MADRSAQLRPLVLGGAMLLVGAVEVAASLLFGGGRTLPAVEHLPLVLVFVVGAYWPLGGQPGAASVSPRLQQAAAAAVLGAVALAVLALASAEGPGHGAFTQLPWQLAIAAVYGGVLVACALASRIRALAVLAAVTAAASALLSVAERGGLHVGSALPLLAGCLIAGDGVLRWRPRPAPPPPEARAGILAALPEGGVEALHRAARRGLESWFEDGTAEIQLGGIAMAGGLVDLVLGVPAPADLRGLGIGAGQLLVIAAAALGTVARRRFKDRVTAPRAGSVEPRVPRTAVAALAAAMTALFVVLTLWPLLFGALWRGGDHAAVWAAEQAVMPPVTAGLLAIPVAWFARLSRIGTLYQVAAFTLVLGALLSSSNLQGYVGAAIVSLVAGAFLAAGGALRMRRFLWRTST